MEEKGLGVSEKEGEAWMDCVSPPPKVPYIENVRRGVDVPR